MTDPNPTFGRFSLQRSLGKGSFGEVWQARDPQLNRDVAIKVLHQGLISDARFIQNATREAQLVGKIDHPNIIKIYEVGEIAGRVYIEMEYIDGQPLSVLLASGKKLTFGQALAIIDQLASALDASHAKKIIHRDVKPANLLVDKQGNIHLVDFGLAHAALSSLGPSSDLVGIGTAMYMSPEQAAGRAGDQTSDVYSLGVIAYELFTGRLPFQADNLLGYIKAHVDQKPPYPSQINPAISNDLQKALLKALNKESAKRFRSAGDFARALHRATERPFKKAKKDGGSRLGLVVALALVLIVMCGAVYLAGKQSYPQLLRLAAGDIAGALPTPNTVEVTQSAILTQPPGAGVIPATQSPALPTEPNQAPILPAAANPLATLAPVEPNQPIVQAVSLQLLGGANAAAGLGRLTVLVRNGLGEPIKDQYVRLYSQKKDLSGAWVIDQSLKDGYTDNAGQVNFEAGPGNYIVRSDFRGYNFGNATDVQGQVDVPVQAGQTTQITISLGRLMVGFLRGDNSVVEGQYVRIYMQKQDLAGNWVVADSPSDGHTDNSGVIYFNLTPGNYIVASDFQGYNWGNAGDVEGMASVAVQPGQETRLIYALGQLAVGLVDANGQPQADQYIRIYQQVKDVNGNPAAGDEASNGRTDNTGQVVFNLTAGSYALRIGDNILYDVPVESGRITFSNGLTFQFK